ncbi:MAG TPA: YCF48-related protein [Candidatus Acidoferrum sp.]|jgi:hypothetical protein
MAPDDRDQLFEKALARHLRPAASSSPDASVLSGGPADLCPDPELLAAYHDGSLSHDERNLWKPHVLGCERCQLVLAHLATPLDLPVLAEADADIAAEKGAMKAEAPKKQAHENVVVLAQPASAAKTLSPARPTPRPSPVHTLRWLWLVPAGAIAASFIAWVSLHESKPLPAISSSPVEVAESRESSSVAPSAKLEPAPSAESREKALNKEQEKIQEKEQERNRLTAPSPAAAASANRDLASGAPQNQLQLNQQSPSQYSAKSSNGPSISQQKQEQQIGRTAAGNIVGGVLDQKKLDAQAALPLRIAPKPAPSQPSSPPPASEPSFLDDSSVAPSAKDKVAPAPPPPPPPSLTNANSTVTNAGAVSSVAESVEVNSAATATTTESVAKTPLKARAVLRAAALQNPHVFVAPGGKHLWRLGPAGSLEHSNDKGVTWTPQISGVYTDLLAGSAPSAKISWIVGAAGTILRTTDGGTHWTKLDAPLNADLTAITATDAHRAKIAFAPDPQSGQVKSYETKDGGVTWSLVPNQ